MKLDDFLKRKKVRCINRGNHGYLTENKVYDVIGAVFGRLKMRNDNGDNVWYDMTCFELVIESAENPLQGVELTPEFETESSEPKFKVGDKVYLFGTNYIEEITKIIGANVYLAGADFDASVSVKEICHATPENYERLQATFTDIEFERPPTQADIDNEAVEPIFKVDNKVYYRAYADICVVSDVSDLGEVQIKGWGEDYYNSRYFCHATQENYEMLCNLYPHIEFEQPPTQAVLDE